MLAISLAASTCLLVVYFLCVLHSFSAVSETLQGPGRERLLLGLTVGRFYPTDSRFWSTALGLSFTVVSV